MATTSKGYPYPAGTDRVVDGDNVLQALATMVDGALGLGACGVVTIPITAPATGAQATVTFPVGRFTAPPIVQATNGAGVAATNTRGPIVHSTIPVSTTGCTLSAGRDSGSSTFPCHWMAVQLP